MRIRLRSKITLLFMSWGLLLAVPAVALAADVINADLIDFNSQNADYTAGATNGVQTAYWVEADNNGCDPADGGALSFKLKVIRQSDNADVTASAFKARLATAAAGTEQALNNFTLTFDKCSTAANNQPPNNTQTVIFTSDANLDPGKYKVEADTSAALINDPNDLDNTYSASNQNSFLYKRERSRGHGCRLVTACQTATDNCPTPPMRIRPTPTRRQGDACDATRRT